MRRLWLDCQARKRVAVLFLVYWLTTLAVIPMTRVGDIPGLVLLLTTPLIAGALVGRWRASTPERVARSCDRITGGMLAGVLIAELTLLVMKGGVVEHVIDWMHGDRFRGAEVLGFCIASGVLGALLGLAGAVLDMILGRIRRQGRPAPSA